MFLFRSTEKSGGRGKPLFAIGANAFRTTNFRSRSAMRGAEFHGNSGRDGTTRILSIPEMISTSYLANVRRQTKVYHFQQSATLAAGPGPEASENVVAPVKK